MYRLFLVALCITCLTCVGCGGGDPDLGRVSGTVTMDDEPLSNVSVTFTPVGGGRPSTGTTDESGEYTLGFVDQPGALVGTHKVSVTTMTNIAADTEMSSDSAAYEAQATGTAEDYEKYTQEESIPAKYNTETILEYEVKPGSNTIDIELESE